MRACLFQPGERGRIAGLMRIASTDTQRAALLQAAAPVEAALQVAQALEWDRCLTCLALQLCCWTWPADAVAQLPEADGVSGC